MYSQSKDPSYPTYTGECSLKSLHPKKTLVKVMYVLIMVFKILHEISYIE